MSSIITPEEIRFVLGNEEFNPRSVYTKPLTIKETTLLKAGLFIGDTLVGEPWQQHFRNINKN